MLCAQAAPQLGFQMGGSPSSKQPSPLCRCFHICLKRAEMLALFHLPSSHELSWEPPPKASHSFFPGTDEVPLTPPFSKPSFHVAAPTHHIWLWSGSPGPTWAPDSHLPSSNLLLSVNKKKQHQTPFLTQFFTSPNSPFSV